MIIKKTRKIRKDHAGKRFGKLTVLSYVGHIAEKDPVWNCKCECGQEKVVRMRCLQNGTTKTCGSCPKESGSAHYAWKGCGELPRDIYNTIYHGAKARGLEFDVSIEDLWKLFVVQEGRCAFTGEEISFNKTYRSKTDRTASLDRIDSSKGYVLDNVQWVHRDINKLKKNLSDERFLQICIAVAKGPKAHNK